MSSWDRPPAGTTVAAFFESWLPEAFEASGRHGASDAPRVRATLSGPDGGAWEVQAEVDRLVVERGAAPAPPDVWLRQSTADFRAALEGDADLPALLPPGWSALDLLFL